MSLLVFKVIFKKKNFIPAIVFFGLLFSQENNSPEEFDKEKNFLEPQQIMRLFNANQIAYKNIYFKFRELNNGFLRRGELYFKKPSFLKIQYFKSDLTKSDSIYSDGKTLYVYMKKRELVLEEDLSHFSPDKDSEFSSRKKINSYLVHVNDLIQHYNFNFVKSKNKQIILSRQEAKNYRVNTSDDFTAYHLSLTPKDLSTGRDNMELWVSSDGEIIRVKNKSFNGKVLEFLFFGIKYDQELAKNFFDFVPPVKVQIINNFINQFNELPTE